MLKNKKLLLGMVVSAVISAGSHSAWAQTVPGGVLHKLPQHW